MSTNGCAGDNELETKVTQRCHCPAQHPTPVLEPSSAKRKQTDQQISYLSSVIALAGGFEGRSNDRSNLILYRTRANDTLLHAQQTRIARDRSTTRYEWLKELRWAERASRSTMSAATTDGHAIFEVGSWRGPKVWRDHAVQRYDVSTTRE